MKLYLVSPLTSGLPFDSLSYFSKDQISLGSLVYITIKKRKVPGIIISAQNIEDERMSIKNATFAIKKINEEDRQDFIDPDLMEAITLAGDITLSYLPNLLRTLIPERLLEKRDGTKLYSNKKVRRSELFLLSLPREERFTRYKSLTRESFAKNESLVIFFPTITELLKAEIELSKGISDYVISLHSKVTQKNTKDIDEKLHSSHPLLILSTPSLHAFVRADIGQIVIENEMSHYYINHDGIDLRTLFTCITKELSLPLLFSATLLSLERYQLLKEGMAVDLMPLYMRSDNCFTLIKMDEVEKQGSPYLCFESLKEIEKLRNVGAGHYFIYTQRKGMYPTTICADCSTLLTCKKCDKPLVMHSIGSTRTYMCHYCEELTRITEENPVHCKKCGSWRMRMLGIASSGMESLFRESGIPVFVIDGERTKTKKEIQQTLDGYKKAPLAILIGTELALNVLEECDSSVIASLDSLFSLPEYSIDERIVSLIIDLKQKTKDKLLLQTRMSKNPLFSYLTDYSFHNYYAWALEERKNLHLPPFYSVIKCAFTSLHDDEKNFIAKALTDKKNEHVFFEAGPQKLLLFIHIKKEDWESNKEERERIRTLCAQGKMEYNPQNFFT